MSRAKPVDAALHRCQKNLLSKCLDCVLYLGQPESSDPTDEQVDVSHVLTLCRDNKTDEIVQQGMSLQEALSANRFPLNGYRFDRDEFQVY